MRALAILSLFTLWMINTPGFLAGAEPAQTDTRPIAQLIAELDDDNFIIREQATRLLLARGPEVIEPLKDAVAKTTSPEVRARANHVLQALSIHDGGGKVVGGLKLRLSADTDKIRPGSKLTLTTTLCNMTDEDINVQVGFSTCGNYFECGANLRVLDATGREGKQHWRVDLCGTGAGPVFVTVPARGTIQYVSRVQLHTEDDTLMYASKYVSAEAPRAGTHRLCTVLSATAGQSKLPVAGFPANPRASYWTGELRSNILELEVVH
ncbi:MAG: HEAT repeat domain-containing protein [Gemmataceae bacterium]